MPLDKHNQIWYHYINNMEHWHGVGYNTNVTVLTHYNVYAGYKHIINGRDKLHGIVRYHVRPQIG